jgi:hypothetical protein
MREVSERGTKKKERKTFGRRRNMLLGADLCFVLVVVL